MVVVLDLGEVLAKIQCQLECIRVFLWVAKMPEGRPVRSADLSATAAIFGDVVAMGAYREALLDGMTINEVEVKKYLNVDYFPGRRNEALQKTVEAKIGGALTRMVIPGGVTVTRKATTFRATFIGLPFHVKIARYAKNEVSSQSYSAVIAGLQKYNDMNDCDVVRFRYWYGDINSTSGYVVIVMESLTRDLESVFRQNENGECVGSSWVCDWRC